MTNYLLKMTPAILTLTTTTTTMAFISSPLRYHRPFVTTSNSASTNFRYPSTKIIPNLSSIIPMSPIIPTARLRQRSLSSPSTTHHHLQMSFFSNLFSAPLEPKIDYDALPHPCPELGNAALNNTTLTTSLQNPHLHVATFAGGCFWGLELAFQRLPGVMYTAVGYTQGREVDPTYGSVSAGATGHTEAVCVYYDEGVCGYESLLDCFFGRVDPTTVDGQGRDYGRQYRTGVYYHSKKQEDTARARFELEQTKYKKPIATELKTTMPFWPAEMYHQQYLEKGGRSGVPQDASKGATDPIRCYG